MNGELELGDIQELIPQMFEIIRNRGLDVAPLRAWVREVVDVKKVKKSDVELFVSTVSLTDRKGLEIKINDLPEDEICDMLLASAITRASVSKSSAESSIPTAALSTVCPCMRL